MSGGGAGCRMSERLRTTDGHGLLGAVAVARAELPLLLVLLSRAEEHSRGQSDRGRRDEGQCSD